MRLLECLGSDETIEVLIGSRWLHLGARIDRGLVRHYAGRLFATIASGILQMPIYDTQCGTKFFRVNEAFLAAIDEPFLSRWSFDVELIGRLYAGGYPLKVFREEPLETWIDVSGSKINMFDMLRATLELIPIASELRRIRRANRT